MGSSTCHLAPLASPLHFESCGFGSQRKSQYADSPYKPPLDFDLPDYKAFGATLLDLTRSYHFDDASPPELDEDFGFISPLNWDMLALPKLGEPGPIPFYTLRISSHISVSSYRRRQSFPRTQARN
jgi:hypothetical protein